MESWAFFNNYVFQWSTAYTLPYSLNSECIEPFFKGKIEGAKLLLFILIFLNDNVLNQTAGVYRAMLS